MSEQKVGGPVSYHPPRLIINVLQDGSCAAKERTTLNPDEINSYREKVLE